MTRNGSWVVPPFDGAIDLILAIVAEEGQIEEGQS